MMEDHLGPLVRLEGISTAQLPRGGKGIHSSTVSSNERLLDGSGAIIAPDLETFVSRVLHEAIPFIDDVAPRSGRPSTWKSKSSPKHFTSSKAAVHLYTRVVTGKDIDAIKGMNQYTADRKDETWFCRRSVHENKAEKGTASWSEFVNTFKDYHSESEMAFTPTVVGARKAMSWDTKGLEVVIQHETWKDIEIVVVEMLHKIDPKPLKNRVFPVLQLTAELVSTREFVVISTPVIDFDKSPYAEYSKDKALVVAAYTSIERIRVLPEGGAIEWIMATASDAKGVLPQWMQKMAVPDAVARDVNLFMVWITSERSRKVKSDLALKSDPTEKSVPAAPVASASSKAGSPSDSAVNGKSAEDTGSAKRTPFLASV